jgi:outer membrane protein assembly factor BamB
VVVLLSTHEDRLRRSSRPRLVGLDAATGTIRYVQRQPTSPIAPGEVAIAAGTAIVVGGMSDLSGYDAATGKRLWSTEDP